ncbi:MAG: isoprenylcysteine carboxylmethyltransferase family protein [Bryobacteraceae bacterium]
MRNIVLGGLASFCFGSFGWGMARHFRRDGPVSAGAAATGVLGFVFAAAQLGALAARPVVYFWLAAGLYVASLGLFCLAVLATRGKGLGVCFEKTVPGGVVTAGPYRWIRHPFYVAYLLCWLAGWAAVAWWPLGASVAVMGWLYRRSAIAEERALEAAHGEAYRAYVRRTGRFWPKASAWSSRFEYRAGGVGACRIDPGK